MTLVIGAGREAGRNGLQETDVGTGACLQSLARALLRNELACVVVLRPDGTIVLISEPGRRLLGLEAAGSLVGRDWAALWSSADAAAMREALAAAGASGAGRFRAFGPRAGSAQRWWDMMLTPCEDGELAGCVLASVRDVTDLVEAAEKKAQNERLEALGQLTGGVAHDFNNLLTVMMGAAEALAEDLPVGTEGYELANLALSAAEKGADLVSRLLAFSRQRPLRLAPVDVGELLTTGAAFIRRAVGERIAVTCHAPEEPLLCVADRLTLDTIMLNLCVNARDAMPDGGELRASARRVAGADFGAGELGLVESDYVHIAVTDTGVGMSPEVLQRAMEPFFTTKPVGRGTGLGLSSAYGCVRQFGGHVAIASTVGEGTTVSLYIPVAEAPAASEVAALAARSPAQVGRRILLVEDNELVRDQTSRQLRALGYRVAVAASGEAALERLMWTDERFDLLFTDLVISKGLSGRDLAIAARAIDPAIRLLFTSGHAPEAWIKRLRLPEEARVMRKPYRRGELARTVAETLASPPAPEPAEAAA